MKIKPDASRAFLEAKNVERREDIAAPKDTSTPSVGKTQGEPRPVTAEDVRKTPAGTSSKHAFVQEISAHSKANAARLRDENLTLLKDEPDPAAALEQLEQEVARDLEVLVRRSAKGFAGVLRDLRMKTVWEEPGKRDPKYLGYREEVEREIGVFEHQPHYGYAAADDLMKGAGTEFGDVVVKLRGVEDRVTFCMFDSFDQGTRDNYQQNCFTLEDLPQLIINQRLSKLFEEMPFAYDEAQIFGGVQAADISRVDLPEGPEFDALAKKTVELLPWVEVQRYAKADDRATFGGGDPA